MDAFALQLKNIAPEFYTTLKYHTSWIYVIWAFLTDSDVGPWTRMKRKTPVGTPADAPVMATGVSCPPASYRPVFPVRPTAVFHRWILLLPLQDCRMLCRPPAQQQ